MPYDKKGSDWMTSLERLLPLDVRHAFRFRFCSRIFVVNSWVMNYDSYDHWSHECEGHLITGHVINVISVIKKHNFDFSITTRMEDPTLKILELIRQSNSYPDPFLIIRDPRTSRRTISHIGTYLKRFLLHGGSASQLICGTPIPHRLCVNRPMV